MRPALILIALGALAPVSGSAVEAELTLYGTLLPFADTSRTVGATGPGVVPDRNGAASQVPAAAYTGIDIPSRLRLTSGTSNLGFKGNLEINAHLKVFFQLESAVSPDGDPPNAWASRNSAVGVAGDWGTALVGNWDTPYKYPLLFVGPLRGLNPFDNALTANPGFNVPGTTTQNGRSAGKADAAFNRRQGNSIQYWTPSWQGLSGRFAYAFGEGRTTPNAGGPSVTPILWSLLASYDHDWFGVRYAYEQHRDYFGLAQIGGSAGATTANASSRDDAHELVGFVSLPTGTKVSAIGERLAYRSDDSTAGAVKGYHREAVYFLVQQRFGDHQLWGSLGKAWDGTCEKTGGAACSTEGLGGRQVALGYSYSLAKAADVYAAFYEMDNGRSASYAVFPSPGVVAPGATTRGFGIGLLYTFGATWGGVPKATP